MSNIGKASVERGSAGRQAEADKDHHYALHFPEDKALVAPLAVEMFGYMPQRSEATLSRLAWLAVGRRKDTDAAALSKSPLPEDLAALQRYRVMLGKLRASISRDLWRTNAGLASEAIQKITDKRPSFLLAAGIPRGDSEPAFMHGYPAAALPHALLPSASAGSVAAAGSAAAAGVSSAGASDVLAD